MPIRAISTACLHFFKKKLFYREIKKARHFVRPFNFSDVTILKNYTAAAALVGAPHGAGNSLVCCPQTPPSAAGGGGGGGADS